MQQIKIKTETYNNYIFNEDSVNYKVSGYTNCIRTFNHVF